MSNLDYGDVDAEKQLLGALVVHPEWLQLVDPIVHADDFHAPRNGHLYHLIGEVYRANPQGFSAIVLADKVKSKRDKSLSNRLIEALAAPPASAFATVEHARIIARHARTFRTAALSAQLQEAVEADDVEAVARLTAELVNITQKPEGGDSVTQLVDQWLDGEVDDTMLVSSGIDESWLFVDIDEILAGDVEPPSPTILHFDGGEQERTIALMYAGRINGLHGPSGVGKSMVALYACAQEIRAGRNVLWVDYEEPRADAVVSRLKRLFGITDGEIRQRFMAVTPKDLWTPQVATLLRQSYSRYRWSLVVIDSTGEAFGVEGVSENNDDEVAPWFRRIPRVLAEMGPAVIVIDHSKKAQDDPLHPAGSKRKRAAIQGSAWLATTDDPPSLDKGGKIMLTCAKDRHGWWRQGHKVGALYVGDPGPGGRQVRLRRFLEDDDAADTGESWLRRKILEVLRDEGPVSQSAFGSALRKADVKVSDRRLKEIVDYCCERGWLAISEPKKRGQAARLSFVSFPGGDPGPTPPTEEF